jgi:hypothetical protein
LRGLAGERIEGDGGSDDGEEEGVGGQEEGAAAASGGAGAAEDVEWVGTYVQWVAENQVSDKITLELTMWMFHELAASDPESHATLLGLGAGEVIAVLADRAGEYQEAQVWACAALWQLAGSPEGEAHLLNTDAVGTVLACAERFPESNEMLVFAMGALSALCCSGEGQNMLGEKKAHDLVLTCLGYPDVAANSEIRRWACAVLAFMVDDHPVNAMLLAKTKALQRVCECLEEPVQARKKGSKGGSNAVVDPLVASCAVLAIDKMLTVLPENRAAFQEGDKTGKLSGTRLRKLLACMEKHNAVLDVHEFGCSALRSLSQGSSSSARSTEVAAMVEAGVREAVAASQGHFPTDWTVDAHAKRTLAALSSGYFGWSAMWVRAMVSDVFMHRSRSALADRLIAQPPGGSGAAGAEREV